MITKTKKTESASLSESLLQALLYKGSYDSKEVLRVSTVIIHLFIFVTGKMLIALRNTSLSTPTWEPISETWETKDMADTAQASLIRTAQRSALEELSLNVKARGIKPIGFRFKTISPKGRLIRGESFSTNLKPSILSTIKLNSEELVDYRLVNIKEAIEMLGHPEAVSGLKHLITHFSRRSFC